MPIVQQRRAQLLFQHTITPQPATANANGVITQSSWRTPAFDLWPALSFFIRRFGFPYESRFGGEPWTVGEQSTAVLLWSTPPGFTRAEFPAVSDRYPNAFLVIEQAGEFKGYLDFSEGQQQTQITHRNRWLWGRGQPQFDAFDTINHAAITLSFWQPLDDIHRTDDTWLIDWDGDSSFDHNDSDVSEDLDSYSYQHGLQVQSDITNLPISAADGLLRLRNKTGKYSAASPNAISASRLRQRNLVRHVNSEGDILFEGHLEPPKTLDENGLSFAEFTIAGKTRENLNREVYRVYTTGDNATAFRDVCADVGITVGDVTTPTIPLKNAVVSGEAVQGFRDLRAVSASWIFENEIGAMSMVSSLGLERSPQRDH